MPIIDAINGLVTSGIIYSIILIGLAIFGFIINDILKMTQYAGIPNPYKSDIETFFHFVSLGLLGLSLFIIILAIPLVSFTQNALETFVRVEIIDEEIAINFAKLLGAALFFSIGYIILYGVVFFIGVYYRFGNAIWVEVEFTDHTKKQFNSFICDSDDFYYFEDKDKFRMWEGRRKSDIIRISALEEESRISRWLEQLVNLLIRGGNWIAIKIKDHKKEKKV